MLMSQLRISAFISVSPSTAPPAAAPPPPRAKRPKRLIRPTERVARSPTRGSTVASPRACAMTPATCQARCMCLPGTIVPLPPSSRKSYSLHFSVFPVDARCGDVNPHRGAPSRGLEWARFKAASATDPAGRRTVHFPTTLPFSKPTLRMTPIYAISDISRWREYYAPEVGCY